MRKILSIVFFVFIFLVVPLNAHAAAAWKPVAPEGYKPITWAKAPGVASFFKAPLNSGSLDFITRINLAQNQVQFIATTTSAPVDWGQGNASFIPSVAAPSRATTTETVDPFAATGVADPNVVSIDAPKSSYHNFAFARFMAESGKAVVPAAQFIWNGPFFNVTALTSDLSMAIKTSVGTTTVISSGSRPASDMSLPRRMLLVNNSTGKAVIKDFEVDGFVHATSSDVALEGFAPTVLKGDNVSGGTARLFVGVVPGGKELVIYCSRGASVQEASDALVAAGVPTENQLQADGGGSASCGYNLPGQYFVEPSRSLPLLMGAVTLVGRGVITTEGTNVRSGPAAKNAVVTKLPKNTPVRIFAEKNGWYRIGDGMWVIKSLIKKQ